jgi:hypothetical protein
MPIVKRLGTLAVAMLMLLAPALWNRFPLLQFDSGGYIARWYEGTLEESRSTVYGLFLNLLTYPDFWPAIIAQAAVTLWVLALVLRAYGIGGRPRLLLVILGALSLLTTLSWLADQLLTDIFAGLAVLALHVLVMHPDRLARWERIALLAVIAFAAATHSATLMLLLALIAAGLVLGLFFRSRISFAQSGHVGLTLALSVVLVFAANYFVAQRLAWTPGGIGLTFGRMLQDGIVARYLNDHCPNPKLRLCEHRAELPTDADMFFWGEGVFNRLGRFAGLNDEMREIVLGCLQDYPSLEIRTAVADWAKQLVLVRTGYGINNEIWHTYGMIQNFVPSARADMEAARQQRGELGPVFEVVNRVHVPVTWTAMVLLIGLCGLGVVYSRFNDLGWLAATVTLAILLNALLFGVLSGPHDRYGARLAFMAPLVLLMAPWRPRPRISP